MFGVPRYANHLFTLICRCCCKYGFFAVQMIYLLLDYSLFEGAFEAVKLFNFCTSNFLCFTDFELLLFLLLSQQMYRGGKILLGKGFKAQALHQGFKVFMGNHFWNSSTHLTDGASNIYNYKNGNYRKKSNKIACKCTQRTPSTSGKGIWLTYGIDYLSMYSLVTSERRLLSTPVKWVPHSPVCSGLCRIFSWC